MQSHISLMTANTNSYKPHEVQILTQRLCGCGSDGVLVIARACCIRVLIYKDLMLVIAEVCCMRVLMQLLF